MSAITDLEYKISHLELAGLPNTTVSTYTAMQIMDAHTLAIVVLTNRHAQLIEQTITTQDLGAKQVIADRGVITIKI